MVSIIAGSLVIHLLVLGLLPRVDFNTAAPVGRTISVTVSAAAVSNTSSEAPIEASEPEINDLQSDERSPPEKSELSTPQPETSNSPSPLSSDIPIDQADVSVQTPSSEDSAVVEAIHNSAQQKTDVEHEINEPDQTDLVAADPADTPAETLEPEAKSESDLSAESSESLESELPPDTKEDASIPHLRGPSEQVIDSPIRPSNEGDFHQAVFLGVKPKVIRPAIAKKKRLRGEVILRGLITTGGQLQDVSVFQTSGHAVLDTAAVEQAITWQFKPATEGGSVIDQWVQIPVVFQ
jgi:TonB family protein